MAWGAPTGAALGLLSEATVRRRSLHTHVTLSACALAGAATVYPLARHDRSVAPPEALAVLAAAGIGFASRVLPSRRARTLVAAGWAAHAAFDFAHRREHRTRLPDWYPSLCAAFDLVAAGSLLAR